ncbi:hypothetical protein SAMN05216525_104243 [Bradyrhizobium sp. Gha]|nr:hypothetical protein SAMN05216525_104243 [Bradyrhizobium sp. Gha]
MNRNAAISRARSHLASGDFEAALSRLVAIPPESQNPERKHQLAEYLGQARCMLEDLGCDCQVLAAAGTQFLYAQRIEDPSLLTVLGYGTATWFVAWMKLGPQEGLLGVSQN